MPFAFPLDLDRHWKGYPKPSGLGCHHLGAPSQPGSQVSQLSFTACFPSLTP